MEHAAVNIPRPGFKRSEVNLVVSYTKIGRYSRSENYR